MILFSPPINRSHHTDDGGLTDHGNAPATSNKRTKYHSPGVLKPREYTSKAMRAEGHVWGAWVLIWRGRGQASRPH